MRGGKAYEAASVLLPGAIALTYTSVLMLTEIVVGAGSTPLTCALFAVLPGKFRKNNMSNTPFNK